MNNSPFLALVAKDLYEKFGCDFSNITLVLPSNRARLFMDKYLIELASNKPIWSPQYSNSARLFEQGSNLQLLDDPVHKIKLIWNLYQSYKKHVVSGETFDQFYFFGEMLLSDFDEIDKYLVPAEQLFSNLSNWELYKDLSYLTEEQKESIKRFFNYDTDLKMQFFSIWNHLEKIYTDFREELFSRRKAYDGMLMRQVMESLQNNDDKTIEKFSQEKYIFIGYNYLTPVERRLMKWLQEKDKALFYWDFDNYYLNNEAGRFLKTYIAEFGNTLNLQSDCFSKEKDITLLETSGAAAQTGYIAQWLTELGRDDFDDAETAIVLCDEKLLPAALNAIPEYVDSLNVAIFFDLTQTPIAGLIPMLIDMQIKGFRGEAVNYDYLQPVLRHPYIQKIYPQAKQDDKYILRSRRFYVHPNETIEYISKNAASDKKETIVVLTDGAVFKHAKNAKELIIYLKDITQRVGMEGKETFDQIEKESIFKVYQMLNNLAELWETGDVQSGVNNEIGIIILARLVKRLLLSEKAPYYGEPARGLQIMAMSDTRNMDFKNIMLLSVNEGVMPKIEPPPSFIPPILRKYFRMSGINEQDSQYAYYFYRLLQRAENVVMTYDVSAQATGKGEMSRYLMQLITEYPFRDKIKRYRLSGALKTTPVSPVSVKKRIEMFDYWIRDGKPLSPSALNTYIDCPLQFYFKYIENLREPDELNGELDNALLGSIFHKAMQLICEDMKSARPNGVITAEYFEPYIIDKNHHPELSEKSGKLLEKAFESEYFHTAVPRDKYNGEQLIYYSVIEKMVINTLIYDKRNGVEIIGLEEPNYRTITLQSGTQVNVGGIIDRLDKRGETVFLIDYKTGAPPDDNDYDQEMSKIFEENRKSKSKYLLQVFLYCYVLAQKEAYVNAAIAPRLFFPLRADDENYSPEVKLEKEIITRFSEINDDFEILLKKKLEELFDVQTDFHQCRKASTCEYCEYSLVCGRKSA